MVLSALIGAFFASLFGVVIAEGISWILVGSTDSYKQIQQNIARAEAKLKKLKEEKGNSTRKIEAAKLELDDANRESSLTKAKSMFAVAIVMISIVGALNSAFDGTPAAKLPFEPFWFMHAMTHRTLLGEDYRECSALFLYIMISMAIRPTIQKLFGTAPPRGQQNQSFLPTF